MQSRSVKVVVISPFTAERTALELLLRGEGYQVSSAVDRAQGLALAALDHADVIIADTQLLALDGVALVRELARRCPHARAILMCARANQPDELSGVVCMTKPIDVAELCRHLTDVTVATTSKVA